MPGEIPVPVLAVRELGPGWQPGGQGLAPSSNRCKEPGAHQGPGGESGARGVNQGPGGESGARPGG